MGRRVQLEGHPAIPHLPHHGELVMPSFPMLCGSIAAHPSRIGQAVHNATYRKMGLACSYVAFGTTSSPADVVLSMRTLGLRGLAVTMPYKEAILPYLDRIDPVAQRIGAVNTIVNDDGLLTGYNVDWLGAMLALESHAIPIADRRVAIVGAGGVARAIVYGLLDRRAAQIVIFNRTQERAQRLASEFQVEYGGDLRALHSQFDLIVHATAAGHLSQLNACIVPEEILESSISVMDVVPEPLDTPLIELATQHGCRVVRGYEMRVHQAAAQIELYTGQAPPLDFMTSVLLEAMRR